MKLLILGATGRTGVHILEQAISRGYEVNVLVRNPGKINISSEKLTIFDGTPENREDVRRAMIGCDAVIVALNILRTSDNPWAKIVSPTNLISTSIKNVITCMKELEVSRIVTLSAQGAGDSFPENPAILKWIINNSNLSVSYKEHAEQENLLQASDLAFTVLRPMGLKNSPLTKNLLVSYGGNPKPKLTISRAHVAKFALDILSNDSFYRKMPTISEY